jgi:hypothetical protein
MTEYRFRDGAALIQQVDPAPFSLKQIRAALSLLRRKRQFAAMGSLASTFFMAGHADAVIRRQWAQSLLDQNRVTQALTALREASTEFASDPLEGPELRGLIGRAYKQLYVNDGDGKNLVAAIDAYRGDWLARRGDYRWQGINLVALVARAQRDSVSGYEPIDPQATAKEILEDIDLRGAGGYWDYATALEAAVALGDQDTALVNLKKYILHPDTDAFEIASTLRQLKEVWRAQELPIGQQIIPVLEHALLQREGGAVEPSKIEPKKAKQAFEAVYGTQSYTYLTWMDGLMARCLGVARVRDRETQKPEGTGFLLPGKVLKEEWGDAPVLLTNSHVASDNPSDEAPLRPNEVEAEFTRIAGSPRVNFGAVLFSSPRVELDVTIVRLIPPEKAGPLEFTPYVPKIGTDVENPQRIYVIGHPNGGDMVVSMYDNSLAEHENPFVRYRSPTDGGSSGSPACNSQLRAFAIHHRALVERELNEGIVLALIKAVL